MRKLTLVIAICSLAYVTTYFDCGSNYSPPSGEGGFYIETFTNGAFSPFVYVDGQCQGDYSGAQGSVYSFDNVITDIVGNADISGGRAPAIWVFTDLSGQCAGYTSNPFPVGLQQTIYLNCLGGGVGSGLTPPHPTPCIPLAHRQRSQSPAAASRPLTASPELSIITMTGLTWGRPLPPPPPQPRSALLHPAASAAIQPGFMWA